MEGINIGHWATCHPSRKHASRGRCAPCYERARKYGFKVGQYEQMVADQEGRCALCGIEVDGGELVVDHDHATNKVRALICSHCNTGLGMFKDDPKLLDAAKAYLSRFATNNSPIDMVVLN